MKQRHQIETKQGPKKTKKKQKKNDQQRQQNKNEKKAINGDHRRIIKEREMTKTYKNQSLLAISNQEIGPKLFKQCFPASGRKIDILIH